MCLATLDWLSVVTRGMAHLGVITAVASLPARYAIKPLPFAMGGVALGWNSVRLARRVSVDLANVAAGGGGRYGTHDEVVATLAEDTREQVCHVRCQSPVGLRRGTLVQVVCEALQLVASFTAARAVGSHAAVFVVGATAVQGLSSAMLATCVHGTRPDELVFLRYLLDCHIRCRDTLV